MTNLLPKLREIAVDPTKLYLDPNNPRFLTKDEDQICESRFLDLDVIEKTTERMKRKEFNYEEIKKSILANGWQPVDFIFVKKFEHENDRYVVLEGNRRVTAVKDLLSNRKTPIEIRDQITTINVMEVVDKIDKRSPKKSKRELDKKINYLLGVRHHGSLKTWSPFAQAASIYERYLSFANQEHSNFNWNDEVADKVARILNMKKKDVRERIQIFRAMTQIGEHPIVKNSEEEGGGMKSRFYSVCGAPLTMDNKAMNRYICQDPADFSLDDDTLNRFINLCNFNKKGRTGAPINNPQQWRFLKDILEDADLEKREQNLKRIEIDKEKPEIVRADRLEELRQPKWDFWLNDVARIFKGLNLGQLATDRESPEFQREQKAMKRITSLIDELETHTDGN